MESVISDPMTESAVIDEEDEEFYENLEAPMYVDFTAPDLAQPDDGSWFCLKIGCDQNHEQIDPEAIDKSFMLRVMAARSPNVRLHKAIKRSNGRLNANCPHSAPAKQPRSRLHRLSTATAVPDKIANSRLRDHPISSLKSPQSQTKKMVLKAIEEKAAISTPKNQKMNSKYQPASGGKNGSAFFSAKPLFSSSPKKEIKEVCANIRKLNLNGTKKRSVPSRYLGKVSKAAKRCDQSDPNDSNVKQETEIAPTEKKTRPLWKTKQLPSKEKVKKLGPDVPKRDQNLESDPKKECLRPRRKLTWATRKASVEQATMSRVENEDSGDELVLEPESKGNSGANNTNKKKKLEMGPKRKGSRPLWKSNKPVPKSNMEDSTTSGIKNEEVVTNEKLKRKIMCNLDTGVEKDGLKTKLKNCGNVIGGAKNEKLVRKVGLKCKVRHNSRTWVQKDEIITETDNCDGNCDNIISGNIEEKVVRKVGLKSKVRHNSRTRVQKDVLITESDNCDEDKENIMQNGSKRAEVRKNLKIEGKTNSLLRTIENVPPQQVLKPQKKLSQANQDQVARNKKTTNPKPFRFRTDERGILKEANMEKKKLVQSEPPKDENKNIARKETGAERCKANMEKKKLVQSEPPKDENKNIARKETGAERCKGRVVPSKFHGLTNGLTSLESKRKNAPSLCGKEQELIANANSIRVGTKRISVGNTKSWNLEG